MRVFYTDGSAVPNPGRGGYAVIENEKPIALGSEDGESTNIRMEAYAIISALELADGKPCQIYTDSQFWINVITKWAVNWHKNSWTKKGGEIKNLDLVQKAFDLYSKSKAELIFVRAHKGNIGNELADTWANKARTGERI